MDGTIKQIVRHASVFGLGAILSRLASIVLLPLYTRYLHPADYGVIALIDLTVNLLGIAAGAGIGSAATREHFQGKTSEHIDRVWWTALAMVAVTGVAVFLLPFLTRAALAHMVFGEEVRNGSHYFGLAIPTLWIGVVTYVVESYFRTQKASTFLVSVGLCRLLLNVALNVAFLAWLQLGVAAVLWGNLLTSAATLVVELAVFARQRGRMRIDTNLLRPYWRFGWPLILHGFLSVMMHEADRFVLQVYSNLEQVGLYAVAYQIGQGANTLIITPFLTIWGVLVYEVARQEDRAIVYARVFKNFVMGLAVLLLTASFFAGPLLYILAPPEYAPATRIVPIVCLAYLFFSLHEHFKVPALIENRTVAMLPVVALSAGVNIAMNLLLIPRFGAFGAAWASVATFAFFSGVGLLQYRRIARYPYPFASCSAVVLGIVATFTVYQAFINRMPNVTVQMLIAVVLSATWGVALFGGAALQLASGNPWRAVFVKSRSRRTEGSTASQEP